MEFSLNETDAMGSSEQGNDRFWFLFWKLTLTCLRKTDKAGRSGMGGAGRTCKKLLP